MKLFIQEDIINRYPKLRIAVVTATKVDNHTYPDALRLKKSEAVKRLRTALNLDTLSSHPHIVAWRETYRSFGVKPKDHRPTVEAIARRVLKGDSVPTISAVVDTYLINELDNLLPIGGYDLSKLSGDLRLKFAGGGEEFYPIGATEPEQTKAGEVIYCDAQRVLTRRWNYRDADYTKITESSENIALFIEAALGDIPSVAVEKAASELGQALKELSQDEVKVTIHDVSKHGNICILE